MIEAIESHLADWAARRLGAIAAESGLVPTVTAVAGTIDGGTGPANQAQLEVRIEDLELLSEDRQLGQASAERPEELRCRARIAMRLVEPQDDTLRDGVDGAVVDPAAAEPATGGLALLALLSQFRDAMRPGADAGAPSADHPDSARGWISVGRGSREARLEWRDLSIGAIARDDQGQRRAWRWTCAAECRFALSPRALDGGRILQVAAEHADRGTSTSYAPAEHLALDRFDGVAAATRDELAGKGVRSLGELMDRDGVAALIAGLRTADDATRDALTRCVDAGRVRRRYAGMVFGGPLDAELMALPCRALTAPASAEEDATLRRGLARPEVQGRVAMLGLPVVAVLTAEAKNAVRVGTLLALPGSGGG